MGLSNLQLAVNGAVEAAVAIASAVLIVYLPEEVTGPRRGLMVFNFVHLAIYCVSATAYGTYSYIFTREFSHLEPLQNILTDCSPPQYGH